MRNIIRNLVVFISLICYLPIFAQVSGFDDKVDIGNGLYKVKTNNRWGIIDKDENLKLSIEYNEPIFANGKALVTAYGTDRLVGVVDSLGSFSPTPSYYINPKYPFVSDGMLAVRMAPDTEWGILNTETGALIEFDFKGYKPGKNKELKNLGINGKGVKGSFVFDFVGPFVEGMSAVHTARTGWHHIDKNGKERLKNPNQKPSMFRSSLHDGESIIFDERGIVLCKEDPNGYAGVMKYIDGDYELKDYALCLRNGDDIQTKNCILVLNDLYQADTYENRLTGDSIIFIERVAVEPVKLVEEPTDSFTLSRDIKVSLPKKVVSAGAKGTAAVTVDVSNIGEFESKEVSVAIYIKDSHKSWSGIITSGATQQITLYVPAKFSAASISREVEWVIKSGQNEVSGGEKVTIKRYKPARR